MKLNWLRESAYSHSGVRSEFARIVKDDPAFARKMTAFLAQAYNLKVAADYAVGSNHTIGAEESAEAVAEVASFVASIERSLLSRRP